MDTPVTPIVNTAKTFTNQAQSFSQKKKLYDLLFAGLGLLCLGFALFSLLILIGNLAMEGLPRIDSQFLTSFPSRLAGKAGVFSAWVGSFLVMITAAIVVIPVGICAGIYLEEYAPNNIATKIIELNIINLAAIPSITFGLMALSIFVYKFEFGRSILSAGLTLGLLVLPIIIVTTREALRSIPQNIREAAYALGATKSQVAASHLLPYSMGGILTGVIIALSRAIGETAPVITIGALSFISFLPPSPISPEAPYINFAWLKSEFTVLPVQMFNWLSRPQSDFHINAAATGMILLTLTLILNGAAIYLRFRLRKKYQW